MNFRGKGSLSLSQGLNLGSDSLSLGREGAHRSNGRRYVV
jgi:hypothetical protein